MRAARLLEKLQRKLGQDKLDTLPRYRREHEVHFAWNGVSKEPFYHLDQCSQEDREMRFLVATPALCVRGTERRERLYGSGHHQSALDADAAAFGETDRLLERVDEEQIPFTALPGIAQARRREVEVGPDLLKERTQVQA